MAQLTLGIVGTVIGGPIGGFIGSAIGSMIDNQLFPTKTQGPRLSDLTVQTSTYGNAIPLILGPENRVSGNVIWSTGLIETAVKKRSGKGGPAVVSTTYTYSVSFAVSFADCAKRGAIKSIKQIWANKKLIYDTTGTTTPINAGLWSSITFYDGSFTQNPDPTMEAHLGVGEVPGYRGTAYAVIADFQLADYGNRLPSFEFLVEADESMIGAKALTIIADLCGIDSTKISTSAIRGNLRGFTIGTNSSGTAALQPLALVFNFDAAQVGGALRFASRDDGAIATIPLAWLSGHQGGEDRPNALQWTNALETRLPREATIVFPDPDRNYQQNSQTARRQAGSANSNLSTELPVTVDVATARTLADRLLWEAQTGRQTANCQTDDRLINVEAGRCYAVQTPAGIEPIRIKAWTRGANGVIELEVARDRTEVYQSTATGVAVPLPPQTVNVPGPSDIVLIDGPILQDADDDTGFYYAVDGEASGWRGADVVRSVDGGSTYDEVSPVGFESMIGTIDALASAPTSVFDRANVIRVTLDSEDDELESVTELDVLNGKNVCWIGPADGQDGEVLQYAVADLVAPGVYDLSTLLRGRLGTEYAVGLHVPGETFVSLALGAIQRADFSAADWNKTRDYKAVSLLTAEADATPVVFENTGEGKRPLSPVHISSTTVAGDMLIAWFRRSRYRQAGLGGGPLALGEASEAYEIDIYDGVTFKRTLTASAETVTYAAADLATDGFVAGDTVTVKVYQMSDVRGRGRPGTGTVTL